MMLESAKSLLAKINRRLEDMNDDSLRADKLKTQKEIIEKTFLPMLDPAHATIHRDESGSLSMVQ